MLGTVSANGLGQAKPAVAALCWGECQPKQHARRLQRAYCDLCSLMRLSLPDGSGGVRGPCEQARPQEVVSMGRLICRLVMVSALAAALACVAVVPWSAVSAGTAAMTLGRADKLTAAVARTSSLDGISDTAAAGSGAPAVTDLKYPYACTSATSYGSVLIKPSQWAKGLVNTGHDGANFNVYSN